MIAGVFTPFAVALVYGREDFSNSCVGNIYCLTDRNAGTVEGFPRVILSHIVAGMMMMVYPSLALSLLSDWIEEDLV